MNFFKLLRQSPWSARIGMLMVLVEIAEGPECAAGFDIPRLVKRRPNPPCACETPDGSRNDTRQQPQSVET